MKTLNEVIEELQYWDTCHEYPECFYDDEVTRDALHYLKEFKRYQDTPSRNGHMTLVDYFEESQKNEPLTWDELKLMEGRPVWVEDNINEPEDTQKYWAIYRRIDKAQETEYALLSDFFYDKAQYGETWQVYRKEKQ